MNKEEAIKRLMSSLPFDDGKLYGICLGVFSEQERDAILAAFSFAREVRDGGRPGIKGWWEGMEKAWVSVESKIGGDPLVRPFIKY